MAKYFWIAAGLRGAYMPDNSCVIKVETRRELKEAVAWEASFYADAGFVGASKKAVAWLAATAWKESQKASPAILPYVLPLARERRSGYAFGVSPALLPARNGRSTPMPTTEQITACGTLQPMFVEKVDLCRRWVTEVLEAVEGFDDVYGTNLSEVENRSRDGFIPFTDGGFDGLGYATLGYAHGSGAAPSVIQPYLDSAIKDAEQAWDGENPDHTVAWIYADDDADQLTLPGIEKSRERGRWREKWHEFEDESLREGDTYFYKVRVLFHGDHHDSESGEPEALFCVGINTDFEYGRDHISWLSCYGKSPNCTTWVWEKTVKVADLTEEMVETFIKEAAKALAEA